MVRKINEKEMGFLIEEFTEKTYQTKNELKYRIQAPDSIQDVWPQIKEYRYSRGVKTALKDQKDNYFWYYLPRSTKAKLNYIDKIAAFDLFQNIKSSDKKTVLLDALIDEGFSSSVIEGAFSTKKIAKEMYQKKIAPKNKSEKMILNNINAMDYILENLSYPLNEEMLLNIYRILTENTLEEGEQVDKYRDSQVYVIDPNSTQAAYVPPPHTQVQALMDSLMEFISSPDDLHPVVKACIIHFYFVYIHPFFDGNGRTARAISYMYLLQKGYDFFKFFSVSSVVGQQRSKYYKALKDTEDFDSDLSYFISFYVEMIEKSIDQTLDRAKRESGYQLLLTHLNKTGIILSKRHEKALKIYLKADKNYTTIEEYSKKLKVVYETARTDLNQLTDLGLFKKSQLGKQFIYTIISFDEIIERLSTPTVK